MSTMTSGGNGPARPPVGPMGPGFGPGRGMGPGGMGMPVEKAKDVRSAARRIAARLRPERLWIVLVLGLAAVAVVFQVLGPKLLGNATNLIFEGVIGRMIPAGVTKEQAIAALRAQGQDSLADMLASMNVIPGQGVDFTALSRIITLVVVIYLLASAFMWAQQWIMAGVTQRVIYRLREDVDHKIGRLPLTYFDTHSRGDLLSRVTNDIDNISTALQQTLTQLITSVMTVVGVLIMMLLISPLLAVISLLTVPLSFVITMVIAKRSQPQFVEQWKWTGKLNGHVEEMITGHEVVKVFGHRQRAIEQFDEANERMYASSFKAQFISGIIQPAMMFISNLNYVAIAVIGGLQIASGRISLGDVQAFIQYSRQFTMPITQIASTANVAQSGLASAERVFQLLDAAEEMPDPVPAYPYPDASGRIHLDAVSFRYVPDQPLIEDFTLHVEPGQTVAIVGPTGAGKTTLVNLLMRFYEIDAGAITLDGVDSRAMSRDDLRRSFGMVLQDTWLFGGTIRDNIAYGRAGATADEILAASRAANVDHFVRTLPDGYDTVLDDEASNVSAGERQLLTIARAFLADPAVLILDEATSSVDTRTEQLIQKAMSELRRGRTSFVIAHRLSTIRDADVILVMDRGRVVEQGTHRDLIAARGFYFDLHQSQFAEDAPPPGSTPPNGR